MKRQLLIFQFYGRKLVAPLTGRRHKVLGLLITMGPIATALSAYEGSAPFTVTFGLWAFSGYLKKLAVNACDWEDQLRWKHQVSTNIKKHVHRINLSSDALIALSTGIMSFNVYKTGHHPESALIASAAAVVCGATRSNVRRNGGWRQLLKPLNV